MNDEASCADSPMPKLLKPMRPICGWGGGGASALSADSPLDLKVKSSVICDLLTLAGIQPYDRDAYRLEQRRKEGMRFERLARGEASSKQVRAT